MKHASSILLLGAAAAALFMPGLGATASQAPDVPTAVTKLSSTLDWMHTTKKTGGLGYSIAQVQRTNAYAALVALGGTWPTVTPPPPPPPPTSGQVTVSTTGNDATCSRNGTACATFDRAFQIAQGGDTVAVAGGIYAQSTASSPEIDRPATMIFASDTPKTGIVTFTCASGASVTFAAPGFALYPGLTNIAFVGPCFHFNSVAMGFGGYPAKVDGVTFDGVHMAAFECNGCGDTMIKNSLIGPMISCWDTGHGAGNCDPSDIAYGEDYWAAHGGWKSAYSTVAFAHYGAAGPVTNLVLDHDTFAGFNIRDSQSLHIECLFLWGFQGVKVMNSTFSNCATFDLYISADAIASGLMITSSSFAGPVWDLDEAGGTLPGVERAKDWRDLTVFTKAGFALTNWVIQNNVFSHGINLDPNGVGPSIINGVTVSGNNLGSNTVCSVDVTFTGNSSCG